MPSGSTDPERLLAAAGRVGEVRAHADELVAEVLDHLVVLGEREVQVAVDGFVEQVADTLSAVSAEATEVALGLTNVAHRAGEAEASVADDVRDVGAPRWQQ
jgi:hypothetical protein